ncbi:extracellular solute-binding protein [Kineococcus arenarius]|uniref:extracellular solute-binding protein n=1 Tax=unclassified Kineococcus TaxID=2621656 RepID=UPI003D7C9FD0
MTAPSRRAFLRGTALTAGLAGTGVLSSCATPLTAVGTESSLQYWNFFAGGDGLRMIGLVDTFRAEHPEVDVTATTLAWGSPYYTKLAMAAAGGRPPDVASMHLSRLPTFAEHLLEPFDLDELAELGITEADFPAPLWQKATVNGELFAVPLDSHPFVLFYNTEICGQAGLLEADGTLKPITSPQELIEFGRRCAEVTGGNGIAYAAADAFVNWMMFWTLYSQNGGTLELPPGGTAQFDREKMVEVLTFMQEFTDGEVVSQTADAAGAIAVFGSNQAGLLLTGEWEVSTFITTGTPFSMQEFPQLYGTEAVRGDGHSFVLPRQRDLDEESRRNAYLFIASALKNSLSWGEGGHIPAYGPVSESQEYLALTPQSNYRGAAEKIAFDPDAYFSGSGSSLMGQAGQILAALHLQSITPDEAVDQLEAWLNKQLATPSPV